MDGSHSILDNISEEVNLKNVPIQRNISLYLDLKALCILILFFNKKRFSIVHSVSPKAGLLSAIAGWVSQRPNRLHTFTGQVWSTKKGFRRWILKLLDKIIVFLNTKILVDSISQQDFLVKENVLSKNTSIVLGLGSISGVDTQRFIPSKEHRRFIRKELNIKNDSLIFLFVGRLKKEKGLFELVEAFKNLCKVQVNLALLIVGPDEENLKPDLINNLGDKKEFIRFVEFTKTPEHFMAASDVFILPSYREGFGSVVVEAASCSLPSICSNIYGLIDTIKDNETGLLVPVRSSKLLEDAMLKLSYDADYRNQMGKNARNRVIKHFSHETITFAILKLYKGLLEE